ncbi:FMN-binding protein [Amycolatopsis sp. FDAARGOS 1241]|uniref:FMN-binding protein n=1 Tax=Amycolatopsis sp. FDAARGOS 1241 TaxID=2778070 RepID=UPI00194E6A3B|nr:FMN-binding protein [Amycolatopsis sp. FDAARGOS 1241]QRP50143.1 FMN-binding protein [Amycolatopsis sp. FDAARGOS 1241]
MRRIAITFATTISVLVLLFSYRTSTNQDPVASQVPGVVRPPATTSAPPVTGSGGGTFSGQAADTPYGPVQVEITVSGGRITDARVLQVPRESGRDVRINSAAVPQLNQETLQAQSAQIDTVSGATYTSQGYLQSLQSAIDAAHR